MNRGPFGVRLSLTILLVTLSPSLSAQSDSEITITGTVYYSGAHSGPVHVVVADGNNVNSFVDDPDESDVPLAGHTIIAEPGPYSLTIPHALAGHSYIVAAQMDIDNSNAVVLDSFQNYEPSGRNVKCSWGDCNGPDPIPSELLSSRDIDIYLSDYEPLCVLLDTFEADFFSGGAGDMGYYAGHLWICDSPSRYGSGPTDIHRIDPSTGELVESYDLGINHCTSLQWIGDDMWICFKSPTSWTVRQYTYDGQEFTHGRSYLLDSGSMDNDMVWSVSIAWDGSLLWAQERGPCGNIYKLDLSDGLLLDTVTECEFTLGKWLGLGDIADICFFDGFLWAMNDDAPTFAKMTPDPNQFSVDMHYTFAFDPNMDDFDYFGRYYGMAKHGDLIYFIEGIDVEDADGKVTGRKHRIHTAYIEQSDLSSRDLISKLGGQYWFGSLSVDVDTNVPRGKRGSVSITGNQWDQEWDDYDGHHTFSSTFTTKNQPDGSIDVKFSGETYNIAWNGDVMIHADTSPKGIAVLRYDDRGHGKSTGTPEMEIGFDQLAEDLKVAVTMLRKRDDIAEIGLFGHSLGGIIAPYMQTKYNGADFIMILSGSFIPGEQIARDQAKTMPNIWRLSKDMTDEECTETGIRFAKSRSQYARNGEGLDVVEETLYKLINWQIDNLTEEQIKENLQYYKDVDEFRKKSYEGALRYYTSPHQLSFVSHDPAKYIAKVTCPVLVLFGDKDKHVTVEKNRAPLMHAMADSLSSDFTVKIIADADHAYATFGLNQKWDVLPGMLDCVTSWIQARTGNLDSGDVTTPNETVSPTQ